MTLSDTSAADINDNDNNNNNNNNNNDLFFRSLFSSRKPVPSILRSSNINPYRSAQLTNFPGTTDEEVAVINSPLSNSQKIMLEDVFVSDPIVRRSVTLFTKFLLGKRTKTTVDINKEFMTPDAQEQALATTFKQQEIDELKTMIDKINRQVKLREKTEAAVNQTLVGGRSALLVEKQQGGMPVDLKVLNWGKLGRVFVDKDTWQLLAVEYADRKKEEPILAEEMIYFTWQDYHITPDSLYHGLSAIQPIADMSETIRLMTSEDLKETARSSWASSGLIKFPPNTSQSKITDFLAGFYPGTWNATSQSVTVEAHDLNPKIKDMMEVVKEGYRLLNQGLGIPEFLLASGEVPNKSVADLAMNAWRESDLNHARSWLQGLLEPQWFDSLIMLRFPDVDMQQMLLKAKLEFEDVTFESLKDRVDSIIPLWQAGLITLEKALKMLDMEDILEALLAEQEKKRLEEEAQRKAELEKLRLQQQQQQQQGEEGDQSIINKNPTRGPTTTMQRMRREEQQQIGQLPQASAEITDLKQYIVEQLKQASSHTNNNNNNNNNNKEQEEIDTVHKRLAESEHKLKMELLHKQASLVERMERRLAKFEQ